ncbi:efflux RND transporter periplasmic adaptor subunit [Hydrogenophaga sp. PAMC20947]|uniref:efflux RND transporter periplasmic adaptor subunit n=1 Tax=Hydrogenophaga sp. PAMC20947 TaxID=2565558 RepID=UPI001445F259|nr:efflux RND transporter periplasmic adaptor subunit [Hydrogenophaga sp. PAMC20947]
MNRLRSPWVVLMTVLCLAAAVAWVATRTEPVQAQAPAQSSAPASAPAKAEGGRKGGRDDAPIPVIVAPVTEGSDGVELTLLGTGSARKSVTVHSPVDGEVAEVLFKPGKAVRAGDVLLRLVDRRERLAVDLAAAKVDAARVMHTRYEATRGTGAVPDTVSDEARAALRTAEIEWSQAREELSDRVVRAPFAGTPGLAAVEKGERINTDTVLTTLDDRDELHLDLQIPEAYLARVSVGQPLLAVNPAHPARRFEGRVIQIDSRVDPVTRQIKVRAVLPNADDVLRSGMSFQVNLALPGERRLSVPELALQWGRDGSFVWVVRKGKAVQVAARAVQRQDGRVLVDGGLTAQDSVVVEGVQRMREGRTVKVVGAEASGSASP